MVWHLLKHMRGKQALAWANHDDAADLEMAQSVVRWTIMLPYAVRAHVTRPKDLPSLTEVRKASTAHPLDIYSPISVQYSRLDQLQSSFQKAVQDTVRCMLWVTVLTGEA